MRKERGRTSGINKHNNQPVGPRNNSHIWAKGVGGVAGGVGEEGEEWGERRERRRDDNDNAKEKAAARSSVSFSSEKEAEEP